MKFSKSSSWSIRQRISLVGVVSVCMAAGVSAQVYEGIKEPTYPPVEIFGGAPPYRFRWVEKAEDRRGLCLIDWSGPDSTWQPFGSRVCTEAGAPADMGAQWLLSTMFNSATEDPYANFEGLVGNMGTGRCMEWKPALANEAIPDLPYQATTYGNLTSERCDLQNQYQYFKLKDWRNPDSKLNFIPRMWNHTCPEDQEPTILAKPIHSLVSYGCGKGLWKGEALTAVWGYWYYDNIEEHMYRVEGVFDRYQTILCCQGEHMLETGFCNEAMRKEGQGDRTPDVFWMQMCTHLFPSYPEFDRNRRENPDPKFVV
ncbi:hypothetical protein TWF730_004773 [Orbilia blumenaviensis]|uniref:Uncharacterized protein n=1 Tax=Orbilia blumenaviensis TaxID=1796055 RepID=A0AAV9TWS3_9PEZI